MPLRGSHPTLFWEPHWAAVNVSSFGPCSDSDPTVLSLEEVDVWARLPVSALVSSAHSDYASRTSLPSLTSALPFAGCSHRRCPLLPRSPASAAEWPLSMEAPASAAWDFLSNSDSCLLLMSLILSVGRERHPVRWAVMTSFISL